MQKKLLYSIFGILFIVILFVAHFIISFGFGGYKGFLSQFQNLPNNTKLEKLRSEAQDHISHEHIQIRSLDGLTLYEETYSDMCAEGEHDWKRSDSFSYVCAYRIAQYYGVSENYDSYLLKIQNKLSEIGWELRKQNPPQKTITEIVQQNMENIFEAEYPVYYKRVDKNRILSLRINNFPGYYSGWSSLEKEPYPFGFSVSSYQIKYENQSQVSPDDIFRRIASSGQQKLFIVISETYFRN